MHWLFWKKIYIKKNCFATNAPKSQFANLQTICPMPLPISSSLCVATSLYGPCIKGTEHVLNITTPDDTFHSNSSFNKTVQFTITYIWASDVSTNHHQTFPNSSISWSLYIYLLSRIFKKCVKILWIVVAVLCDFNAILYLKVNAHVK